MAGEWLDTTWGDIADLKYGKALTAYTDQPNVARVYGTNGPIGWHNTALQPGPGVIVGRKGAYRGVLYADHPFWVIDTAYYLKPLVPMDLRWAYYWLLNYDVNNIDDGSPIPSTTREAFGYTPVKLPPEDEQTKISDLLASLDAKIDLNRQMAATLEELARALFKSWFIDFDPVHAKAEGRDPGLPADIAALFPDCFDDEGVPKGWEWKRADEIARSVRSTANPQVVPPETPYVGLEHLPRKSLGIGSYGNARQVESGKLHFKAGDLLFGKLRPYFHKVSVMPFEGIGSSDILVFRAKQEQYKGLMYFGFSEESFVASASGASTGTRMPRAEWSFMSEQVVASDEGKVLKAFNSIALAHVEEINERLVECRELEQVRDTLLPKLLSGELQVADAETAIAAA